MIKYFVDESEPHLECPNDITVELPPGQDEVFVKFDQPITDLDWFRNVRSIPSWGKRLEAVLKTGLHVVTFYARNSMTKKQTSCLLRIIVKGKYNNLFLKRFYKLILLSLMK